MEKQMRKGAVKDFKAFLNAKFPGLSGKCGSKTGSTVRPYGDYLYSQDKSMFFNDMREAVEKGEFR